MTPEAVVDLYSGAGARDEARSYLAKEGLTDIIKPLEAEDADRIPPDCRDLARLHRVLKARKVFTVLEFGVGYSTLVMADALLNNRRYWERLSEKPKVRNATPFQLHSVDTSRDWLRRMEGQLPEHLGDVVKLHHSEAHAGTFLHRACHFYERLPNVVPDFIYLDGPDPADVSGNVGGLDWSNPDRTVMAADILRMEPLLLPGTLIVVDGRTANARFLAAHLFRNWEVSWGRDGDVTALELQEPPLGRINGETLAYCVGPRAMKWPRR